MEQPDAKTSRSDRQQALRFLKENHTMVVATVSNEGMPHAATVFYTVDDDLSLYFCTGTETNKFLNIKDNAKIAVVIGVGPGVETVQGNGKIEWIVEGKDEVMGLLGKKFDLEQSPFWPIVAMSHAGVALIKISLQQMTFLHVSTENGKYTEEKREISLK